MGHLSDSNSMGPKASNHEIPSTPAPSNAKESVKSGGPESIVYYDGDCGLCDRFVGICLKLDSNKKLHYAPLQGQLAAQFLTIEDRTSLSTVVYQESGVTYRRSEAVIRAMSTFGSAWPFVKIFLLIPARFRDFIYNLVAENRIRVFGKVEQCRIPTPEERTRFHD